MGRAKHDGDDDEAVDLIELAERFSEVGRVLNVHETSQCIKFAEVSSFAEGSELGRAF